MTTLERSRRLARRRRRARVRLAALAAVLLGVLIGVGALQSAGSGPGPAASGPRPSAAVHARQSGTAAGATAGRPGAATGTGGGGRERPATAAELLGERAVDAVRAYKPVIAAGGSRRREVALTFDDGPSRYTSAILSTLRRRAVRATFFVVGQQLNDFAAQFRAELGAGHTVADHTENHRQLPRLSSAAQLGQIRDAALRERLLGARLPRLFRPPYGAFNRTTVRLAGRYGMLVVLWDVDPRDWARPGTGAIVRRVLSRVRPGSIVLMHDGGGIRTQTVSALPAIIDGLRRRHFRLVTLPQLLREDPPGRHQPLPTFVRPSA